MELVLAAFRRAQALQTSAGGRYRGGTGMRHGRRGWGTASRVAAACTLLLFTGAPAQAQPAAAGVPGTGVVSASADPRRGAFDLAVGYGYRTTASTFGEGGFPVRAEAGARWAVQVWEIASAFGVTDRTSIHVRLPILLPSLDHDGLEAPITNPAPAPGDAVLEAHWRVRERRRPYGEWNLTLRGVAPTGVEAPGTLGTALATGTGIPEIGAGLIGRRQFGLAAFSLSAACAFGISQVVPYVSATYSDGTTGPGRLHPGNALRARAAVQIEPIPFFWTGLDASVEYRGPYRTGTTSTRWFPSMNLEPVVDSERLYAEVGMDLAFPVTRRATALLFGRYRFYGKTLPEFASLGLEAFSRPPGLFAGGRIELHL